MAVYSSHTRKIPSVRAVLRDNLNSLAVNRSTVFAFNSRLSQMYASGDTHAREKSKSMLVRTNTACFTCNLKSCTHVRGANCLEFDSANACRSKRVKTISLAALVERNLLGYEQLLARRPQFINCNKH